MTSHSNPVAVTHTDAIKKVCAVCTNLYGQKAIREVTTVEEEDLIKKNIFPGYERQNDIYPQGLCKRCIFHLAALGRGEQPKLKLPEDYFCDVPRTLRSSPAGPCTCRWCFLARLSGPSFLAWQRSLKMATDKPVITFLCTECGRGVAAGQVSHTCSASDLDRIQGILNMVPQEIKGKLTHALLKEQQEEQLAAGDAGNITLPQACI